MTASLHRPGGAVLGGVVGGAEGGGGVLNHLSLFSGIGGIDLAAEAAGFPTVAFCERDPFCRRVLAAHWPGVVCYDDIHDVTADRLRADGIGPIGIISGGPPCQPASVAGKRGGVNDGRWLWPEFLRVVTEVRPRWVVAENPTGILTLDAGRPFGAILAALDALGYVGWWGVWGASTVGASHQRERGFIVGNLADSNSQRELQPQGRILDEWPWAGDGGPSMADTASAGWRPARRAESGSTKEAGAWDHAAGDDEGRTKLAHATSERWDGRTQEQCGNVSNGTDGGRTQGIDLLAERLTGSGRALESGVRRGTHGFSGRLDGLWPARPGQPQAAWEPSRTTVGKLPARSHRLKALGNAVVPAQIYPVFAAIAASILGERAGNSEGEVVA